jgi:hypothetical protein
MKTPPKYPSTKHWPASETIHRDDTVHTNPESFVGRPVVITEKVDGGNTCLSQGEVFARSVAAPSTAGWMAMVKKHHGWKFLHQDHNLTIYGEDIYGIHSIEYEPVQEDQTFRVFAVRDLDYFMSWNAVDDIAKQYSMLTVPVLFRGVFYSIEDITKFFREELPKPSKLGGQREGFVMRTELGFDSESFSDMVCKYVRPNHVQTDQHWTRNWKPCQTI